MFEKPEVICARAKNIRFFHAIVWIMDASPNSDWTVAQVLDSYPQTTAVFLALKTGCVGCNLDKFCRLSEVALAYNMNKEELISRLRVCIQPEEESEP